MPKRILEGVVVSEQREQNGGGERWNAPSCTRSLKKTVRRSKKYHAHDEANAYHEGDLAKIIESAPRRSS